MNIVTDALALYLRYFPLHYKKGGIYKRLLQPACEAKPRVKLVTTPAGVFRCNIQDLLPRYVWLWGTWEPVQSTYAEAHLRPGDVFVDVGANVGWFTVLAGNLGAKVVSFEPVPSIFDQLVQNVELNHLDARLVKAAIYDTEGEVPIYRSSDTLLGLSTTDESRGHTFEAIVPSLPLHSALTAEELKQTRLMKIDVEGAALQATQGLVPILADTRPDFEVLFELESADPSWPGVISEMFAEAGFNAYLIANDYDPETYARKAHKREAPRCDPSTGLYNDVLFSRRDVEVIRW